MPRDDAGPVVLWRLGDALLAVELADVEEVVPINADGRAQARAGSLDVVAPIGLAQRSAPRHAVVLRMGVGAEETRLAVAADDVEGVVESRDADVVDPPVWLAGLESSQFRALVRLGDHRLAALLNAAALFQGR